VEKREKIVKSAHQFKNLFGTRTSIRLFYLHNNLYQCSQLYKKFGKRAFDLTMSALGLVVLAIPIGIVSIIVRATSRGPALFRQERIGKNGKVFIINKFRTMSAEHEDLSSVTAKGDKRITAMGCLLRRYKIDELPQLWNVFVGDMSFVGPRPDVPGYYDKLVGRDRRILDLRPGITGPSTLKYVDEEDILAVQPDPVRFNDEVIFPDKVRINLEYLDNMSLLRDIQLIWKTITGDTSKQEWQA
jgi:lipopolysaccharide/colanic/teichoic acid biosynthesis glycosyltransferase